MTVGVLDAVVGLQIDETVNLRPSWANEFFADKFGASGDEVRGAPLERFVEILDASDVRHSLLFSPMAGPEHDPLSYRPDPEIVARAVERFPAHFSGLLGIDPTRPMKAVADLRHAVLERGFVGAHAYPHWFGLPPDDRLWYPIYAACIELDVPIQVQVGHCLRYSPERPLMNVGHPSTVDRIACHFPELKFVGIHTGWPWQEEMIAVAWKHPNVYIGTDAYAPKHWGPNLVKFIDSWGAGKVMFGTDYPVIKHDRALHEVGELGLRDRSLALLMRDTALSVYRLRNEARRRFDEAS